MEWVYDTGGREKYYKALNVRDCVTRAIAIANGMDYKVTYMTLKRYNGGETPRNGMYSSVYSKMLEDYGWEYVKCEEKGVYLADAEIPADRSVICRLSGHLVAVINGVVHDTWNCSKSNRAKEFLGYWMKPDAESI